MKVIIEKISDSANPEQKILRCSTEVKSAAGNGAEFFQKVDGFTRKRVAFRPMHVDKIAEHGLEEGDDLSEKTGVEWTIQVKESTEPFYDGQNPKIDPSTDEVLLKDGEAIYRQSELTLEAGAEDELIQYNGREKVAVEAEASEDGELA